MIIPIIQKYPTVILANGAFPEHDIPLALLQQAEKVIACDGATVALLEYGREPDFIVGDLDSLSSTLRERFHDRLRQSPDQETNDLTKAVCFSVENGWKRIAILGATGKREDHTLGNISLLADYVAQAEISLYTDYGIFTSISASTVFESFPGQQVSLFCLTPETPLWTESLKYSLDGRALSSWWEGTLNESLDNCFKISLNQGKAIVFRQYK